MKGSPSLDLFQASSYRSYLRAILKDRQAQLKSSTTRLAAKKFGMSQSLLKMVLSGKRDLQINHIHSIAHTLRLGPEQHSFFEALVLHEQSSADIEKRFYQKRINQIRRSMRTHKGETPLKLKTVSHRHIVQSWSTPALLIYLLDFVKVAESGLAQLAQPGIKNEIQNRFGMNQETFATFVQQCEESGLLKFHPDEKIHLSFERLGQVLQRQNYFKNLLQEIQKRMDQDWGKSNTAFESHVFSISEDQIPHLLADYKKLMEKYMAIHAQDISLPKILQISFQMFPVV